MSCVMIAGACLMNAALLHLDAGYNNPYTPDENINKIFDIEVLTPLPDHFYRDEQTNWNAQVGLFFRGGTFVRLGYDHGIDTKKFDIAKRYDIEIKQKLNLSPNSSIVIGAGTSVGGDVRHTNCTNEYSDERTSFFCENYKHDASEFNRNSQRYNLSLKYSYKF